MKMLTLICREKIEDKVFLLLHNLAIKGYTVISGVGGKGQTGTVYRWWGATDRNTVYMIALDDTLMSSLVNAVRELHTRLVQEHAGHEVPLKAFLQPCELIV